MCNIFFLRHIFLSKKMLEHEKLPRTEMSWAKAAAAQAGKASSSSPSSAPTPLLRVVRRIRTFEPRVFLHRQRYILFASLWTGVFVAANVMQYRRMRKLYPDYDALATSQGKMYAGAKVQELNDVRRYNSLVNNMRSDLRGRT